jgi:hypothetical protein
MRGIEQKISEIGRARKIHAVRGFSKKIATPDKFNSKI